jgi:predicted secreted hydrolase
MRESLKAIAFLLLSLLMVIVPRNHQIFAGGESDFLSVTGPCNLAFPKDHGPHPGYRTEWWYYTGNLQAESGTRFGFQLTFFRSQISPPDAEKKWPRQASAWRAQQIYLGHAAITDISGKRHLQAEQVARGALGLAGTSEADGGRIIFIKNWRAQIKENAHHLKAVTDEFSYELTLQPVKQPVLHGQAGYSRKGSARRSASCYYSFTRLKTVGTLTVGGNTMRVEGLTWMDHEFSTAPLEPDIVGWDWFSLQLSDQTELMLYLLKDQNGLVNPASSGTFIDQSGGARHLTREDFKVTATDQWKSPRSGAVYPVAWRLKIAPLAIDLNVVANLNNQEMITTASTGVIYWEGSVSASGTAAQQSVKADGYVELTGYAEALRDPL